MGHCETLDVTHLPYLPALRFRRIAILGLVVVWVVLVSRLVPEPMHPVVSVDELADLEAVTEDASEASLQRLSIFHEGQRVGEISTAVRERGDGLRLTHETRLRLRVLSERRDVRTRITADLNSDGSLRRSVYRIESEGSLYQGRVWRDDRFLRFEAGFGAERSQGEVEVGDEPIHLPVTARLAVAARLVPGQELEFSVFDPMAMRVVPLHVRIGRREPVPDRADALAWRIEETLRGLSSSVWLDEAGQVWAEDAMMGFQARADESMDVAQGDRHDSVFDVERGTGVSVGSIRAARTRPELRLEVSGVDATRLPSNERQHVFEATLVLSRATLEDFGSYTLPHPHEDPRGRYLAAERWIQSDHARIRALAKEIVGEETDAFAVTEALARWVYAYLEKVPVMSVPDALAVLDSGRGDCNEHAVLFTALARAVGLPSRVVAGLVYVNGRFVYHAWSEVRGLRGWLPVDPALGQVPADVTHIALAYDDLWNVSGIIEFVGVLRLTVVGE